MDKSLFEQALRNLKLDQGYFLNVPRDLLYLAMTDRMPQKREIKKLLQDKYSTANYQSLEFYGDKVLNLIGSMIIFQLHGLNITPDELTKFQSTLVKNATLTSISIDENICPLIVKSRHCINFQPPTSVHNICSDSMEAIMGAIYYYGILNGHGQIVEDLYNWFISFQSVRQVIKDYAGFSDKDLSEYLPLTTGPINWQLKIPTDATSVLWSPCVDREVRKKPIVREILKAVGPRRYELRPRRTEVPKIEYKPKTPVSMPKIPVSTAPKTPITVPEMPGTITPPRILSPRVSKVAGAGSLEVRPAEIELPFPRKTGESDVEFLDRIAKHFGSPIEQLMDGTTLYLYLITPQGYLTGMSRNGNYNEAASDLIRNFV